MNARSGHPYKTKPDRAFWARSVSKSFDPLSLIESPDVLIRKDDKVVSAGSCFASNLVPFLERAGLHYLRTEQMHPAFALALRDMSTTAQQHASSDHSEAVASRSLLRAALNLLRRPQAAAPAQPSAPALDNFGYASFSAAYGNIYTVRQLLQLLRRALGVFQPAEAHWVVGDEIVDPFRPGLRYRARSVREFEALTRQHLEQTRLAFATADVFVLTLGLTEAWVSQADGAVFPACPGTVAGTFDPEYHSFQNFTAAEVLSDLGAFVSELRAINPSCRFIFTVSPVPLVATATNDHVLCASTYSKSVLRVAAQEAAERYPDVVYFPAYEIVTGPQAPKAFLAPDRRNVTQEAVETVMAALLSRCEVQQADLPSLETRLPDETASLSAALIEAECEEATSGW